MDGGEASRQDPSQGGTSVGILQAGEAVTLSRVPLYAKRTEGFD